MNNNQEREFRSALANYRTRNKNWNWGTPTNLIGRGGTFTVFSSSRNNVVLGFSNRDPSGRVKVQKILANLNLAPQIYKPVQLQKNVWVTPMNRVKGMTLSHYLNVYKKLNQNAMTKISAELERLHKAGWTHGNIQGNNIILVVSPSGAIEKVVLIDFESSFKGPSQQVNTRALNSMFKPWRPKP